MRATRRVAWILPGALLAVALWLLYGQNDAPSRPPAASLAPAATPAPPAPSAAAPPPAPPASPAAPAARTQVLSVAWGDGPDQLGHLIPEEGAPEGPMSFDVDAEGRLVVLDQVNRRVQIFEDGRRTAGFGLPADTFQDLALTAGGDVALMDRLAGRKLVVYDRAGRPVEEVPLEGAGIPEGGGTTGLFARDDGLWVEYGHEHQVRLADPDGRPDPDRPVLPGRFSADGSRLLLAARAQNGAVVLTADPDRPEAAPELLAEVAFPMPVMRIAALESNLAGRIFLAVQLMRAGAAPPFAPGDLGEQVVALDAAGREVLRVEVPPRSRPEEQFRAYRVGADGALYQLECTDRGVTVWRVAS